MSQYYYKQQRQDDLDSLQQMFESPWTRDMLDAVLDYHNGNVDEAINSLLVMNEHHNGNPQALVEKMLLSNEPKKMPAASGVARRMPTLTPAFPAPKSVIPKSLMKKAPPPRRSEVSITLDGTDTTATITIEKSTRRRVGYPMKLPNDFLRIPKGWNAQKQRQSKSGPLFAPNHLDHLVNMTPPDPLPLSPSKTEDEAETSEIPDTHFRLLRASINLPGFRKSSTSGDNSKTEEKGERAMFGKLTTPNFSVPQLNIPPINMPAFGQSKANPNLPDPSNTKQPGGKRWSLPNLAKANSADKSPSSESQPINPDKPGNRWSLTNINSTIKTAQSNESTEENPTKPTTRWSLPNISTNLKAPSSMLKGSNPHIDAAPAIELDAYAPLSKLEYRGITIKQLRSIIKDMQNQCSTEQWKSLESGETLRPEQVTMYDLIKHYILPKTKEHSCSFVEEAFGKHQREDLVATVPKFFVSHFWGDSVVHLLHCMEQHAVDRGLDVDTVMYWICAFAMNHHFPESLAESNDELLENPWTTQMVMNTTQGMLAVIDPESKYFSRVWCIWEVFLAVWRRNGGDIFSHYYFDVYATNMEGKAVGLTDGPAECDKYPAPKKEGNKSPTKKSPLGKRQPCNPLEWSEHRVIRQSHFPIEACIPALGVNVESAQASLEGDTSRVLNCIIQYDKDDVHGFTTHQAEALVEHPSYTKLNRLVRGTFSVMAYRHILDAATEQPDSDELQTLLDRIRTTFSTAPLEQLEVTVAGCDAFGTREATQFAELLPESLRSVDLDYSFLDFQFSEAFATGFGRLAGNLQSFKLNCAYCSNLSNFTRLWQELEKLVNLKHLVLVIHPNKDLTSIDGLAKAIRNMPDLRTLELEFDLFGDYSKAVAMAKGGATINNFRNIMRQSSNDAERSRELSQRFEKAPKLANLDFSGSYISDASILGLVRVLSTRIHDGKLTSVKLRFLGDVGKKLKTIQTMDDLLQALHRLDQGNANGMKLF